MTLKETLRWRPGPLHLIILFAILQLFVSLLTDGFALSFDEAMWHYIGRNWFTHDLIPYAGGVDNKSPLTFAIFGLSDKLFGVNYWFPRVLGTICQSVGLYYVYKIAKQVAGEKAGMLAVSFYGLSLLWHTTGGKYVSYTETYSVMFIIIAFYRFITAQNHHSFYVSGFLAGIAFGFRLTAIFGIIALVISSLRKGKKNLPAFCAGVISAILLLLLIAFFAGIDLHGLFSYTLADNFGPGSPTDHNLAWKMQNLSDKFIYSGMILFYPLVIGYLIIKRRIDLFALWLIMAFIGINAVGIYDNAHLKEVLSPLSLMSAFATAHLVKVYKFSLKPIFLVIWIMFLPQITEPLSNLKRLITGASAQPMKYCAEPFIKPGEGDVKRLGLWVKANTGEQDKVLVAGFGAQVQVYSERLSPTVYFNVTQTKIAKQRFFKDLQQTRPAMILVPLFSEYKQFVGQDIRQFISDIIARDYELDRCIYNYNVFRIRK